ncbi:Guanine nucleotide exchange factor MSS4 -like protein [Echinococcus granulosus]|uniref:Guanine nucleotide exchange factor mss4 n=1 Tax=Echinococcus granulosus TaxID=6210 RepID=A0A068WLV2_ECHGR|nr:Guanine nucleotide exchange factor MSS4 -like protein [Echinococcus granulosus]CDS18636.1 guanine nucleotide exchange factor mss4 [Echinococcus granulosus]
MDSHVTRGDEKINGKVLNDEVICCPRCPCVIFREKTAFSTNEEFSLPIIAKKSELQQHSGSFPQKTESHFWTVERMTDFENVGFCNTVEGIKYLICADCEIGPLGYHDTHSAAGGQPLFHIAVSRVRTRDTDPLPG